MFIIMYPKCGMRSWNIKNVTVIEVNKPFHQPVRSSSRLTRSAPGRYIHLAARPQVNLYSVGRKRFAHLSEEQDEIHVDANIPWGEDTLFTLEFRDNHYALHTCNNLYLQREGRLQAACSEDCLFAIEYHNGQLALRDRAGRYLSPIGSKVRRRCGGLS